MKPGGKGSFQSVKLRRPGRTAVCSHSARDMAAWCIESDPNYSGAWTKRLCVSEQSEWADENERPKAMSLAAICAPVRKLARVRSYKVRRLNFRCDPRAEVVSRHYK